jgi:hypothetical protein
MLKTLKRKIRRLPLGPARIYPMQRLVATLLSYCILTQIFKVWYIRRFGMWL